jgi:hypothetical protein
MGQYYHPTNVDKKEYLYSHDFNNGLKLMEHSYITNDFVEAVERLLSPNGSWHRCHLVWAGDYMDEKLFIPDDAPLTEKGNVYNLFGYVDDHGKNALEGADKLDREKQTYEERKKLSEQLVEKWLKTLPEKGQYLVNHTKKVYLDLTKEKGDGELWGDGKTPVVIHPLPLLTCSGNGRGGGDYRGRKIKLVGSWAGDEISLEHEPMYEKMKPCNFYEKMKPCNFKER